MGFEAVAGCAEASIAIVLSKKHKGIQSNALNQTDLIYTTRLFILRQDGIGFFLRLVERILCALFARNNADDGLAQDLADI